jgi:hypothetical protein
MFLLLKRNKIYFEIYSLIFFISTVSYFVAFKLLSNYIHYSKWLVLVSLFLIFFIITKIKFKDYLYSIFFIFLIIFFLLFIHSNISVISKNFLIFTLLLIIFNIYIFKTNKTDNEIINLNYINIFILNIINCFALISIMNLSNWNTYSDFLNKNKIYGFICSLLLYLYILIMIFNIRKINKFLIIDNKIYNYIIVTVISLIFLLFSFRHDSLFNKSLSGSPLYHWEYYVGVIKSINENGILLWSIPSQYGFINLLIPAKLLLNSEWYNFYLFQSFLLAIISIISFIIIFNFINKSIINYINIFLLLFLMIFFADSTYIGPYPFPSSSVVRFFCVYLLILFFFIYPSFCNKQLLILSLLFPLSVLWSAESAFYSFSIIIFILISLLIKKEKFLFIKYISCLSFSLFLTIIILVLIYKIKWNLIPDYMNFFDYAIGYAKGFGYVELKPFSAGLYLLLLFSSILYIYNVFIKSKNKIDIDNLSAPIMATAGCLWGISSYFIGRPVVQNITAMIPLIVMPSLILVLYVNKFYKSINLVLVKITLIPLIFIILTTLLIPNFYKTIINIDSFSLNINIKRIKLNSELEGTITMASLNNYSLIFYGNDDDSTEPYFNKKLFGLRENLWLPRPLQLLEIPLKENRKEKYLNRFICMNRVDNGAVIMRNNIDLLNRFKMIHNSILSYYDNIEIISTNEYVVYKYKYKNNINCN